MRSRLTLLGLCVLLIGGLSIVATAQRSSADGDTSLVPRSSEKEREQYPRSVREMMAKLQIEKNKKEYDEMIDRGDQILKLSEDLERSFSATSHITSEDVDRIATVEKLTKKVMDELGGDNSELDQGDQPGEGMPSAADAVKALRESAAKMVDELKKTTRFSISTAAIETSAAVLRLSRLLKVFK